MEGVGGTEGLQGLIRAYKGLLDTTVPLDQAFGFPS